MEPDPIELNVGPRFQLHNAKWDWNTDCVGDECQPTGYEYDYLPYDRLEHEKYEADMSAFNMEYSVRLEFFF